MSKEEGTDYKSYLALIIEFEEKQDGYIQHEWLFAIKNDAVKVANYLRGYGYAAILETRKPFGKPIFYVGVPLSTIKPPK